MKIYSYDVENKKDSNLSIVKFYKFKSKEEILLFNFYVSLINRQTKSMNRSAFLKKKYELYDTKITASVLELENYYKIVYNAKFIRELYLGKDLQGEVIDMLNDMINTYVFEQVELDIIKKDYAIYIDKILENNALVSEDKLLSKISDNYLTIQDMKECLNDITIDDIKRISKEIAILPGYITAVNLKESDIAGYNFSVATDNINIEPIVYKEAKTIETNRNLEQCYVTMGLSVNDYSYIQRSLANLVLGGDVFSFLFKTIREQKHISYSIGSKVSSRNLIMITAGIAIDYKDRIENELKEVLNDIIESGFKNEFKLAQKTLCERFKSSQDNISFLNLMSQLNYINIENKNIDDYIKEIETVKYEDIMKLFIDIRVVGTSLVY